MAYFHLLKTCIKMEEYTRIIAQGGHPVLEPTTEPWGQRTCYIAEPEGNLVEIGSFNRSFESKTNFNGVQWQIQILRGEYI